MAERTGPQPSWRERPDVADVVAMDVQVPLLDGIEATRAVLRFGPGPPKILVVTTFEQDVCAYEALRGDADGFLLERAAPAEMVHAARPAAGCETLLFPTALRELAAAHGNPQARAVLERAALTGREEEVLRLVAGGLSNAEIARRLLVGTETVKPQVSSLLAKLGARDRTHPVIGAYESGFVAPG